MEENAFPQMSFIGVDRYCSSVGTGDSALEHRRWLEFGLGTDAQVLGTNTSRRRRQPHNQRRFQRTKGPLACLSLLSFFTRRKMASPKGAAFEKRLVSSGAAPDLYSSKLPTVH